MSEDATPDATPSPPAALRALASLAGHKGAVTCVDAGAGVAATGAPERLLASGGEDGSIRIWDLATARGVRALLPPEGGEVAAVCLGRGERWGSWVYAAVGRAILGFDLRAPGVLLRQPAWALAASRDDVADLAASEDGSLLAAADDAGDVQLVRLHGAPDAKTAPPTGAYANAHRDSLCTCVAFRPAPGCLASGGTEMCTGGLDCYVARWLPSPDVPPVERWSLAPPAAAASAQLVNPRYVFSLTYSADGETLAVALGDGTLELRDAGCGDLLASADAHHSAASQVRFLGRATAGGAVPLVSAGDDRRLRLWTTHGAVAGFELGSGAAKRRKARRRVCRGGDAELRAAAEVELDEKINWVAVADAQAGGGDAGGGGALACVADTGDAVRIFAVEC